ncbi:MAG TPA: hypothetical protein VHM65_08290 [Candidatus Lustribacter sp.]|nr:hypothetical protein [Candidatus Lustribacter sp.]
MKRLLWVGLGVGVAAGAAVLVIRYGDRLGELARVVRDGMTEREAELRAALGLDTGLSEGHGELDAAAARRLLQDPTGPRAR